jgi:hypothetical protein
MLGKELAQLTNMTQVAEKACKGLTLVSLTNILATLVKLEIK